MKHFCLLAAILLLPSITAAAQGNPPPPAEEIDFSTERLGGERSAPKRPSQQRALIPAGLLFASFDTDGDYAATRSELNVGILRSFTAADKNNNGTLSLVELSQWRERVLGSLDILPGNTQFDKNFDNQIAAAEFQTTLTDLFTGFDRNENGQLEFSEMTKDMPRARREESRKRLRPQPLQDRSRRRLGAN